MKMSINTIWQERKMENIIYLCLLLLIMAFPLISGTVRSVRGDDFHWATVFRWWMGAVPYLILFLIHNTFIIPRYLLSHNIRKYAMTTLLALSLFLTYEYSVFEKHHNESVRPPVPPEHVVRTTMQRPYPIIPMPVVLNSVMALAVLGINLAVAMVFKSQRDQETRKLIENLRLQDELKYLKTQINPHFFMNMLNNIHAMVELDPLKAQDMIMELSKLMRYVLYEGDNHVTTLDKEVCFLSSYLSLMRQRYSPDKVEITADLPSDPSCDIKLPPLLFIAFVENAFKHGISYRWKSEIHLSVRKEGGMISFRCSNTRIPASDRQVSGGVGLDNVKRRLSLIYGDSARLSIDDGEEKYIVDLTIPFHHNFPTLQ